MLKLRSPKFHSTAFNTNKKKKNRNRHCITSQLLQTRNTHHSHVKKYTGQYPTQVYHSGRKDIEENWRSKVKVEVKVTLLTRTEAL